MSQHLRLSYFS